MRHQWGEVAAQIMRMLEENGPMSRSEICDHLGRDKEAVASIVSRLSTRSPNRGKRIHISAYVYDMEGERRYPRAVYALGDKPDKPKPKPDPQANKARYWANKVSRIKTNSVFHLGLSRAKLEQLHGRIKGKPHRREADNRAD